MPFSSLTAIDLIPENSLATPGLFNHIFSQLSDNIGTINAGGTPLDILSGSTWASIGLFANSNNSDYIRMKDSSGQRSTYRLGSAAGGTADGLNIFDESGNTMIASFSKQSIRFYQNVVGPVFDTGGALTSTLNAATFGTGADSKESRIQAAINAASLQGLARVYVPANMYPYSASSVSFVYPVQMVREGGDQSLYDVKAYGAYANFSNDDSAAIQGAVGSAILTKGAVFFPHSAISYKISNAISVTGAAGLTFEGDARGAPIHQTDNTKRVFSGDAISDVNFENLIIGGGFTAAIVLSHITGSTIRGCTISGGTTRELTGLGHCGGILLLSASNVLIENNTLSSNGSWGGSPLVKGADIQIGEDGNTSSNVKINNNTCSSVSVNSNIAVYDTDGYSIDANQCSGAKTRGTSGGYGILAYMSVLSANKNGRVTNNRVFNTEGTGIYLQTLIDGAAADNLVTNSATSETDGSLVVGGIGIADGVRVTLTGGSVSSSGLHGIVVSSLNSSYYGCKVTGVTVDRALGRGIQIRGVANGLTIVGNTVRNTVGVGIGNIDNGAGSTDTLDHVVITGNSLDSIAGAAISLSNLNTSVVAANSINSVGQYGILVDSSSNNNIIALNNITAAARSGGAYDDMLISATSNDVRDNICTGSINIIGAGNRQLNNRASTITLSSGASSMIVTDSGNNLLLTNPTVSSFGLLQFGGVTSSFPALNRNGAGLTVLLADSSGRGTIDAKRFIAIGGAVTEQRQTPTYSASITFDATTGNSFVITATNGTAFTINAPTSPGSGQLIDVTIRNTSGGALGVITWNAVFKMAAFTNPATGFSRTVRFRYDGTNWVEERADVDIPN